MANKYDNMTLEELVNKRAKAERAADIAGTVSGVSGIIGLTSTAASKTLSNKRKSDNQVINQYMTKTNKYLPTDSTTNEYYRTYNKMQNTANPIAAASSVAALGSIPIYAANKVKMNKIQNAINNKLLSSTDNSADDPLNNLTDDQLRTIANYANARRSRSLKGFGLSTGMNIGSRLGKYAINNSDSKVAKSLKNMGGSEILDGLKVGSDVGMVTNLIGAGSYNTDSRKALNILERRKLAKSADNSADDSFENIL